MPAASASFGPLMCKRLTVDEDVAAGGGIGACEDLHQRALSGAVFPISAWISPGKTVKSTPRVEIAKRFGNVAHL